MLYVRLLDNWLQVWCEPSSKMGVEKVFQPPLVVPPETVAL
jgi:hypothetical protein